MGFGVLIAVITVDKTTYNNKGQTMNATVDNLLKSKKVVHSNDVDLAVNCYGEPYNPTLILVHGYPDSSTVWLPMIEHLQHRFHVVTYDVRGCGESTEPAWLWDYSLKRLSEDLQEVMRAVCPTQPVHLVAHDWGSIQTWESVTNHRLQSRIASYTTISGPCLDHVGHWMRSGLGSGDLAQMKKVGNQLLHSWYVAAFQIPLLAPSIWKLGLSKRWHKLVEKIEGVADEPSATQLRDGVNGINLYRANMFPRVGWSPQPKPTTVPVQLLIPLKDNYVSPEMARSCEPFVDKLWCREIDAPHWVVKSEAEWVANCVAEFVEFAETGRQTPSLAKARIKPA